MRNFKNALLCALGSVALVVLSSSTAIAEPHFDIRFDDANSREVKISPRQSGEWLWVKSKDHDGPEKFPLYRVWLDLPEGQVLHSWKNMQKGASGVAVGRPSELPAIAVDTGHAVNQLSVQTQDYLGALRTYSLSLNWSSDRPFFWLDPSCSDRGIEIDTEWNRAKYFYGAAYCEPESDGTVSLYLFHSGDAKWEGANLDSQVAQGQDWAQYNFRLIKGPKAKPVLLGSFGIGSLSNGLVSNNLVRYNPKSVRSLFRYGLGAGLTYVNYHEGPQDITLSQFGVTPKAAITYDVVPDFIDLAASAFVTLFSVKHAPSNISFARFLGANMRFGFKVPTEGYVDWRILTGWYFWTMSTGASPYGIDLLMGPQIFISLKEPLGQGRAWSAYFKYAPLTRNMSQWKFPNREVAIGGGYYMALRGFFKNWGPTIDIANIGYQDPIFANVMTSTSVTLGAQIGF